MTTSGSISFSVSRDDIITEALMHLQALGEGGSPTSAQLSDHSRTLNIMVKALVARGINIWAVDRVTTFLQKNKLSYTVGTDHITRSSNVVRTTLGAAAISGASTITVASITGISTTYNIGVLLDSGTMQWTTVNGAPSGTTVTLTATLTGAAASGNVVYVYSTKLNALSPKVILDTFRRDKSLTDIPVNLISRKEYYQLGNKTVSGVVSQMQWQPNLTSGVITVYPESGNETDTLEFTIKRTLEDFTAAGDTPDFPQEWYEALYMGLAWRLSRVYGKSLPERQSLKMDAEEALRLVEGFDREEETSMYLMPQPHRS